MRLADINTDNRYKVDGYGGVAFYFAGKQTETRKSSSITRMMVRLVEVR